VQPGSGGNSVTIMFKEFGVRLHFTPTILGNDLIHLKVRPEVSSLDFSNAIQLNGFRVPALSTRRTETEVELQDGQTFAIAGLMNNTLNSTMQKIPGIGDIPVLGYLFRSRAYQKNQTELVVMITPVIVRRGSMGVSSGLPSAVEPYLGAPPKTIPQPAPYVGSPVYPPAQQSRPGGMAQAAPEATAPVAAPVSAAAPVAPAPVAVQDAAPLAARPVTPASPAAQAPAPKQDGKAAAKEREAQRKAAEAQKAADKKAAEEKAEADKKAAQEAARQQKLDQERAKRDAEVARKTAEAARRKEEEQKKQDKPLLDAAARLRAAQAAYEAEMAKKKGIQ
jgi:hypothetical protein